MVTPGEETKVMRYLDTSVPSLIIAVVPIMTRLQVSKKDP